jgi:hypothetical protein
VTQSPPDGYAPPFDLDQAGLDAAAATCALLLCHGADWVYRRKEAITVVDERTLHRRMSVDFSISDRLPKGAAEGEFLVPLFLLEKGRAQSTRFDLRDDAGKSLTLTSRHDNAIVSTAVLHAAAEKIVGEQRINDALWNGLATIAQADPGDAVDKLKELELDAEGDPGPGPLRELALNADFRWLAEKLATSSILLVPVRGEAGERKIIKLTFDQDIDDLIGAPRRRVLSAGWTGYSLVVDLPFVGARTYHFEVHVPPGVEVTRARLLVSSRDRFGRAVLRGPRRDMHLYVPDAADQRTGAAVLDMRLGRAGFATGALVASAVVALVLTLCVLLAETIAKGPTSTPALLLALPGLIATYVLRVEDQTITSRLLTWARAVLFVSGLAAYGAALRIGLDPGSETDPLTGAELREWWTPLAAAALLAFLGLLVTRLLPRVPEE